jgi:protein arginine N-methyltransferase 1
VSRVIDEHRLYLRDTHRVSAYERAIGEVVRPGDVVVDLASGTGILGLLACRAGARRVYAIEEGGIAGVARQIARANGFDDRITIVRGHSQSVAIPEPADVVVCDQIGGFGLEADILERAKEVRSRFLRPGGAFIPRRLDLSIALVEHARLRQRLQFWKSRPANLDVTPAFEIAANTGYPARLRGEHLLSPAATAATLDLLVEQPEPLHLSARLRASRAGVLHGVCGWFTAHLSPGVTMTNSPLSDERIFRRPVYFPIQDAVAIEAGTDVDVAMRILPADTMYAWEVRIAPPAGPSATFRQATLRGMLLAREDLERTNPSHRPHLTPRGVARLTVLRLCDGRHTLADIERTVFDEHRDLFASPDQAALFVAEVVTRYGR